VDLRPGLPAAEEGGTMWIALGIIIAVVVAISAYVVIQYLRPPAGNRVERHELTPFEATAAAKPQISGVMSGGGPGGSWTTHQGSSWEDKTLED
jgi:hypothetical protein